MNPSDDAHGGADDAANGAADGADNGADDGSGDGADAIRLTAGERPQFDGETVARQSGVSRETSTRLWRALGFPDTGDAVAYGQGDVDALRLGRELIESGLVTEATVIRLARAVGQTMARLADWQVSALIEAANSNDTDSNDTDGNRADAESGSQLSAAMDLADELAPSFEHLMVYAWRRHLAAAATRAEDLSEADLARLTHTQSVGFADMSRFSLLSNDLDNPGLGSLVETFENVCADHVTGAGGRLIKTLGDAVLYVFDEPELAARVSLQLISTVSARDDLPDIRVGMATGTVVSRLGDVFGPPVNLAARLSNVARSNRLLVDETTASALEDSFELRALPRRPIRGFGMLSPINVMQRRRFRKHDC